MMAGFRSQGLLIGLLVLASVAACSPRTAAPAVHTEPPATAPAPAAPSVARAELLHAVAAAADAFALGSSYPQEAKDMADRRFSLKLPFGCLGADPASDLGYVYDEARQTLKITVKPQVWTGVQPIRDLLGSPDTEAIEGFWVTRPWISTPACPAGTAVPEAGETPQTVGLARIYERNASRLLRRADRPYEVSRKAPAPGGAGLRLVVEGRIVAAADGRAIICRADSPNQHPVCFVRVEFDRVAIENPAGDLYGEWSS